MSLISESLYKVHRVVHNDRMIRIPGLRICTADREVWYVNADYDSKTIKLYRQTSNYPIPTVIDPIVIGKDGLGLPEWFAEIRDPDSYLAWAILDFYTGDDQRENREIEEIEWSLHDKGNIPLP